MYITITHKQTCPVNARTAFKGTNGKKTGIGAKFTVKENIRDKWVGVTVFLPMLY